MEFKKIIIVFFALTMSISVSFSQKYIRVKKSEFKHKEEDFSDAWKNLKKGDRLFRQNKKGAFIQAIPNFLEANRYNDKNAELNYFIGICYLNSGNKYKAKPYIDKAYSINNEVVRDILYLKALANQYNYLFKEAIDDYKSYLENETIEIFLPNKLEKIKIKVDKKISECENGIELLKNPVRCFIDNLGKGVNSKAPEYSPVFFLEDSLLIFTSRRENTTGGRKNPVNKMYYEDSYHSNCEEGTWNKAEQFSRPINTKHNDAVVEISPEGKELCIYRGYKGYGDLFNSKQLANGKWQTNQKMRKIDKKKYRESSVSVSADSMMLFFISDRKKGQGGQDIWFSYRTQDGRKWQKPENMGNVVNTEYDEETVEISSDSKTLYFSSKGHNTMGGYDVFKTERNDDGTWTKPENLGYPINTPDDDVFFMLTPDRFYGYYSAVRKKDGYGDKDIYKITFLGKAKPMFTTEDDTKESIAYFNQPLNETEIEKPVNIKTVQLTLVKGIVSDSLFGSPVEASLRFINNATGRLIKTISSYALTGAYSVYLLPGKYYSLKVDAPGYLAHSENFRIPNDNKEVIEKNIKLQKIIRPLLVKGIVSDSLFGTPIGKAEIKFIDNATDELVKTVFSNAETGAYSVNLLPGKTYTIETKAKDYLTRLEIFPIAYSFDNEDIEKNIKLQKVVPLVKGIVTDAVSGKKLRASLEFVDNVTGELIRTIYSDASTGAYSIYLYPGKKYSLTVKSPDYFYHFENFELADDLTNEIIEKNIELQPMTIGAKIVLNNVFFDTGKADLRSESFVELNRLVDVMDLYPGLTIEISGHTDNVGSDASNKRLSLRRAKAVVNYVTGKSIVRTRLKSEGYGESEPRAENTTPEGRQLNRRVEAKILKK